MTEESKWFHLVSYNELGTVINSINIPGFIAVRTVGIHSVRMLLDDDEPVLLGKDYCGFKWFLEV